MWKEGAVLKLLGANPRQSPWHRYLLILTDRLTHFVELHNFIVQF